MSPESFFFIASFVGLGLLMLFAVVGGIFWLANLAAREVMKGLWR